MSADEIEATNVIYCETRPCTSVFESITEFGDEKITFDNIKSTDIYPSPLVIDIMSLLKRYRGSHITVIDMLRQVALSDTNLSIYLNNFDLVRDEQDCLALFMNILTNYVFVPQCSVEKSLRILSMNF